MSRNISVSKLYNVSIGMILDCGFVGYNPTIKVSIISDTNDNDIKFVVDYKILDNIVKSILKEYIDHKTLYFNKSFEYIIDLIKDIYINGSDNNESICESFQYIEGKSNNIIYDIQDFLYSKILNYIHDNIDINLGVDITVYMNDDINIDLYNINMLHRIYFQTLPDKTEELCKRIHGHKYKLNYLCKDIPDEANVKDIFDLYNEIFNNRLVISKLEIPKYDISKLNFISEYTFNDLYIRIFKLIIPNTNYSFEVAYIDSDTMVTSVESLITFIDNQIKPENKIKDKLMICISETDSTICKIKY